MASLGSLVVDLALESASFMAGMRNAAHQSQATGAAIKSAMDFAKGALKGLAGAFSVSAIVDAAHAAFDYADAIVDLSDRTGASTKVIQEVRYAAQLSGSSVESADAAVGKFSKSLGEAQGGNKEMANGLVKLGVTSGNVDTALRQFADGVSKLPSKAEQNATAMKYMGKSAGDLTLLLSSGADGFDQLANAAHGYGIVLDDDVLRNAGQVNDKLDTLKMIVNADMASMFIQNADAIASMADALIKAAGAAAQFFQQMQIAPLISTQGSNSPISRLMNWDIPHTIKEGIFHGKSADQIQDDDRKTLKTTSIGRKWIMGDLKDRYKTEVHEHGANSMYAQGMKAEYQQVRKQERDYQAGLLKPPKPTGGNGPTLHHISTPTKPKEDHSAEKEASRLEGFNRQLFSAQRSEIQARLSLANEIGDQAKLRLEMLDAEHAEGLRQLALDIKAGKIKGDVNDATTEAGQIAEKMNAEYASQLAAAGRDETEGLAREKLSVAQAGIQNQLDLNAADAAIAKTAGERRKLALEALDLSFQQQRNELEAVVASETATKAEKDIAEAKLKILAGLKGRAQEKVKDETMGPLESYLDSIPDTAAEINEQMQSVEVDGLNSLQEGLMGVVHGTESVKDAFKGMVSSIIDGLLKIALQQAIIKPLAGLLFGGSESSGGGGILGGILGSVVKGVSKGAIKGARANGGYTGAGSYLVGERGPELVQIGNNATVVPNRGLNAVAGAANDNGGLHVHIGNITSNDSVMVRRMVFEGIAQASPMLSDLASNHTITKAGRRKL